MHICNFSIFHKLQHFFVLFRGILKFCSFQSFPFIFSIIIFKLFHISFFIHLSIRPFSLPFSEIPKFLRNFLMRFITLLIANFFSELKAYCLSHSIPLLYIYYYYVLKNFIVSDGFGWFLSDTLFSYHDALQASF